MFKCHSNRVGYFSMYNRDIFLYEVARMYYKDRKTQTEIARNLGITRPTVAKLLKEAVDYGVVGISLRRPNDRYAYLTSKLCDLYNLKSVVICQNDGDIKTKYNLSQILLPNLKKLLEQSNAIGVGWGSTIYEIVNSLPTLTTSVSHVVPLVGGFGIDNPQYHANYIASKLAEKLSTSFLYFYAPAVVDSAQMAHMLMDSVFIKDVIDKARSVELAIVSPDVISEGASLKRFGYMTSIEVTEYQKADITGNILCSFFNRSGKEVSTALSKRMVGLHLKDLKFIPRVLLLACGVKKSLSITGLLRSGVITDLGIDINLAEELILDYGLHMSK